MKKEDLARVEELARRAASVSGVELVDVEYKAEHGGPVLRVFIDKSGGITVDDCTRVSRAVADALDTEDPIPGSYRLEVSSPGVNKTLRSEKDFERFNGRPALLVLKRPLQGRATITGVIRGCGDGTVTIGTDSQREIQVSLRDIARADLPTF